MLSSFAVTGKRFCVHVSMHLCVCVCCTKYSQSLKVLGKPELLADVEVNNSLTQSSTVYTYIGSVESVFELKHIIVSWLS